MKAWGGDRLTPNRVGRTQLVNSAGSKIPGSVLPAKKRRCFNTHSSMSKSEAETRRLDVLQLGRLNGNGSDPFAPSPSIWLQGTLLHPQNVGGASVRRSLPASRSLP